MSPAETAGAEVEKEMSAWKHRLESLQSLPAAAKLIWDASPRLVSADLVLRVLSAVAPVASLWVAKLIIDRVAAAGHPRTVDAHLWLLISAELLLAIVVMVCGRGVDFCEGRIAEEFSSGISQKVIRHATQLDLAHFEDAGFQDLLERARLQATDRADMLSDMGRMIQQLVGLATATAALAVMAPLLLLLVVACMVPAFLAESHYAFATYSLSHELTPQRRELDYLRQLCTSSSSIKEVKLFQLGNFLAGRFSAITRKLIQRSAAVARRRLLVGSVLAAIGSLGYYGAYAMLVVSAYKGNISIGTLTFLSGSLAASSINIQTVFSLFSKIADQFLFLNDLFTFLAVQPEPPKPPAVQTESAHRPGVEFRNVSFSYPGGNRSILRNISFRIEPKERIALVGSNGQGKTTLVKLLARLYEPTEGAILLDGVDLREYSPEHLWERLGIIFQDFVKYEMTAAENIAVGRIAELENHDLLHEAARASGSEATLSKLPNGMNQLLGRRFDGGVDLSGGEWQRLALARAYLRKSGILILDEPTAALDAHTEHEVFTQFSELAEDRMMLLISHRFSTVRIANRILVLDEGVIREEGSHEDLMARQGLYAEMFQVQASNYQ
jgi:ATP-binding cassette subfamily B protein